VTGTQEKKREGGRRVKRGREAGKEREGGGIFEVAEEVAEGGEK